MNQTTKTILSFLGVFLGTWLALKFLLPLLSPFLFGLGLALAAEPVTRLLSRLRLPRSVAALIGVSMAFSVFAMVLLLLGALVVRELGVLAGALPELQEAVLSGAGLLQTRLLGLVGNAPPGIRPLLRRSVSALFTDGAALMDQFLRFFLSLAGNFLSHVPDSALGLGTAVISGFMLSGKLPDIRAWIHTLLPQTTMQPFWETLGRIKKAMVRWLMAQFRLMGLTFAILTGGLLLLRIPYAIFWALGIALVDAFPVLGTGTVLLPWGLISLLQGDRGQALGLVGLYALVTFARSALEPRLVGRELGLDPLLTLMALYIGYRLWGIGGMLLSPLLAVTALQIMPGSHRAVEGKKS